MAFHPCLRIVVLLLLTVCIEQPGFSQEASPPGTQSDSTATLPVVQEDAPVLNPYQKVDAVFKEAVSLMEMVLFYRVGRSEREYIVFERNSVYQRERGSDANFVNIVSDDPGQPAVLTDEQVQVLAAQGKLVDGQVKPYQLGTINGKPVEYVTVKLDSPDGTVKYGDKFAWKSSIGEYRILQKKRNLPGELTVSQSTVDDWDRQGFLKTTSKPKEGQPAYLLSEPVGGIPIVVGWLALGGLFFTLFMRGFNFWGFRHALNIVRGKYDNPKETGEVTHFQALASALSATIGLGNIAGVTIAMTLGGPGAFFWMLLSGFLGMCSKFTECTLGQKYRYVKPDGTVLGGPMRYLKVGLAEMKLGLLGGVLSIVFAVMCVLASFGGGNMLQANQSGSAMLQMFQQGRLQQVSDLNDEIKDAAKVENIDEMLTLQKKKETLVTDISAFEKRFKIIYGIILAALVGAVIIGGIKRIGAAASKIVPSMCIMYSLACLYIILTHISQVPSLVAQIFTEAFTGSAMGGGIVGVLVVGVQRAAFSNEAGAGSAAIAHSAARTEEPIREGCVALLGPFIDTIVVCSMTALVILITGAWDNNEWIVEQGLEGAALTSRAFQEEISWFPILLSIAVTLFAYSTIISWSYYGEKAWETLFGARSTFLYKILAVIAVFIGTIVNLGSVLDFSDMMILGMAFPNILGVVLLSPKVRKDLMEYWARYKAGEFKTYK
ncbi:alanine/glycine:cation symporter family protein [Thalassoglobus polymorphus]|uniref:Amino-acid carrier protein AlsT n=1 Tax=Thalassoglobus polymorphus TaxID=2527994 RepID=A0A517QQJ6_9PLAN|nr:alanine/glycine:cation symporter family protein [Thalassoglobus polymorphus]QDT33920.1 Amino-acid carrier protein AlsT [Thalassoglobus polymorphus]